MKILVATAIYPTPDRPEFGAFVGTQVEALKRIGVDVEPFVLAGANRKLMYLRAIPRLRRRVRRGDVDVVHAHYSYVGAVALAQRTVPVVLTFHGSDLLGTIDSNGREAMFSRAAVVGGKLISRLADAVIVQSAAMAQILHWHPHVHVIPCEVDLNVFQPTEMGEARRLLGLDPARKYVLFAARPDNAVKRFPLAKAAVESLQQRQPSVDLIVVSTETQQRLALYMSACDALVFPSYQEGSPNIVKQAMACNLPIVATDVGDVAQVLGDTEGCFIVEPDARAFAERLGETIRMGMRTNGRDRVQHLASPLVASRLVEVYSDVVKRAQTAGTHAAGRLNCSTGG